MKSNIAVKVIDIESLDVWIKRSYPCWSLGHSGCHVIEIFDAERGIVFLNTAQTEYECNRLET